MQIAIERKDTFRQESTLGRIGLVYESVGEYSKALEYFQRALKLSIEIGHKRNQSFHLSNLGLIYEHMNDYARSMEHYDEALAIARELGSKKTIGSNLGSLANIYFRISSRLTESIEYMRQAIQIAQEIDDVLSEGIHLSNLAIYTKVLESFQIRLIPTPEHYRFFKPWRTKVMHQARCVIWGMYTRISGSMKQPLNIIKRHQKSLKNLGIKELKESTWAI